MSWVPLALFVGLMLPVFLLCWKLADRDDIWPMAILPVWCIFAAFITDAIAGALHIEGY